MKRTPGPLTNIVGRTNYERNVADKDKEEKREANIKDNGGEGKEKREAAVVPQKWVLNAWILPAVSLTLT